MVLLWLSFVQRRKKPQPASVNTVFRRLMPGASAAAGSAELAVREESYQEGPATGFRENHPQANPAFPGKVNIRATTGLFNVTGALLRLYSW